MWAIPQSFSHIRIISCVFPVHLDKGKLDLITSKKLKVMTEVNVFEIVQNKRFDTIT